MDEETTKKRYWNPETRACYLPMQVDRMDDDTKANLVEIEEDYWNELLRQNAEEGKVIRNDSTTNLPVAVEPTLTDEQQLANEMLECEQYLEETNTATLLYLQQLIAPSTLSADSESVEVMTADEFAEIAQKRLQYAARIKEIETILNA